jgi:predicted N-acetyltransferase YhbS
MSAHVNTRAAEAADLPAILKLNAEVFGPGRFTRTAYRIREGTPPVSPYCRVAVLGDRLIAALRMTEVAIGGGTRSLLLGPLAVDPEFKGQGYGRRLVAEVVETAKADGFALVVLVGDEPYYGRLGFVRVPPGQITLPGPVDPMRLLAAECAPGALASARGMVVALRK